MAKKNRKTIPVPETKERPNQELLQRIKRIETSLKHARKDRNERMIVSLEKMLEYFKSLL